MMVKHQVGPAGANVPKPTDWTLGKQQNIDLLIQSPKSLCSCACLYWVRCSTARTIVQTSHNSSILKRVYFILAITRWTTIVNGLPLVLVYNCSSRCLDHLILFNGRARINLASHCRGMVKHIFQLIQVDAAIFRRDF